MAPLTVDERVKMMHSDAAKLKRKERGAFLKTHDLKVKSLRKHAVARVRGSKVKRNSAFVLAGIAKACAKRILEEEKSHLPKDQVTITGIEAHKALELPFLATGPTLFVSKSNEMKPLYPYAINV